MVARRDFEPKIIGFLCNWCCYAGADLAGVSRYQYPPNIRVIRVPCSGRVDPAFILRSFSNGVDGVFMGGCHLGDCHYITQGNYYALSVMHLTKKLLEQVGVNPKRLRLEWVSASEGNRFAQVMIDLTGQIKELGPLGVGEGIDANRLKLKLEAVTRLVPYIKILERKRLRVRFETTEEYDRYFAGDEFKKLFRDLIADKLRTEEIMLLLREKPMSVEEVSEALAISPSEASSYLNHSARQGIVRFDEAQKRFVLADVKEQVLS
ncbi:MAG: hydrogenase iron-sulfur subunit [Chloroflexi bacterium]|nr:hydrogenase iron-sulfur subunit [Chloroflexota bacterium]